MADQHGDCDALASSALDDRLRSELFCGAQPLSLATGLQAGPAEYSQGIYFLLQ